MERRREEKKEERTNKIVSILLPSRLLIIDNWSKSENEILEKITIRFAGNIF